MLPGRRVAAGSAEKACSGPVHHLSRAARSGRLTRHQPDLATDFWAPQAGIPQSELPISRQPEQSSFQQLLFDQLFTWPTDQPRHATSTYGHPVESDRPRNHAGNHWLNASIISRSRAGSTGCALQATGCNERFRDDFLSRYRRSCVGAASQASSRRVATPPLRTSSIRSTFSNRTLSIWATRVGRSAARNSRNALHA